MANAEQLMNELNELAGMPGVEVRETQVFPGVEGEGTKVKKPAAKAIGEIVSEIGPDVRSIEEGSPRQRLMSVMSEKAAICGWIVPYNEKVDIVLTSKEGSYDIKLKEKMSAKVLGCIIKYPEELARYISQEHVQASMQEFKTTTDPMQAKTFDEQLRGTTFKENRVEVMSYTQAINWVSKNCWGTIMEAPEIFVSTKKKTPEGVKVFKSPSDHKKGCFYFIQNKVESVMKRIIDKQSSEDEKKRKVKALTEADLTPLKCSYRRTLPAPGNFVAHKRYETRAVKAAYSAEEAMELNKIYMGSAFNPASKEIYSKKVSNLMPEAASRVSFGADVNNPVFASQYFAAQNSLVASEDIPRWFDKTETGHATDLHLVLKKEVLKTKKDGTSYTKIETVTTAFGDVDDAGNKYGFEPNGAHRNIHKACGGALTEDQLTGFFKTLKSNSRKASAKPNTKVIAGFSAADIRDMINSKYNLTK